MKNKEIKRVVKKQVKKSSGETRSKFIITTLVLTIFVVIVSYIVHIKLLKNNFYRKINSLEKSITATKKESLENKTSAINESETNKDKLKSEVEFLKQKLETNRKDVDILKENISLIKDRQKFEDAKQGVKLKTPKNWSIAPVVPRKEDLYLFKIKPNEQQNCAEKENGKNWCIDNISFGIANNPEKLTFEKYYYEKRGHSKNFTEKLEQTNFKGKLAYEFIYIDAHGGEKNQSLWIQLDNSNFFFINEFYLKENQQEDFEKIVSSIEFEK